MRVTAEGSAITWLTFPSDDRVFAERVREGLRDSGEMAASEAIEHLRARLAPAHPDVTLTLRGAMTGFGDDAIVYVYRDGSVLPKHAGEPPAGTVARVVSDASGAYIEANSEAAELFGVGRETILAAKAGAFTRPDVRVQDAEALWRALTSTGRLHSLSVVQRPDGATVPVEFVTTRDGDGPGRSVTILWPIARASSAPAEASR
jgi:PAS domain S-box-containing protein